VKRYLRIVRGLRPKALVMENVPGMLTIGAGRVIAGIETSLSKLGYDVGVRILYAEDFGVPQQRRRVFIVATTLGSADSLFPNGTHGPAEKPAESGNGYVHRWQPRKGTEPKPLVTVWEAIGDLPRLPNGGGAATMRYSKKPKTGFQVRARRGSRILLNHLTRNLSALMIRRVQYVPEGGNWRDLPRRLLPAGMKRAEKSDHTKRYGRLLREGLCCTILTKADPHWGCYIHPLQDRTISVREAARLQTFPDRFKFRGNMSSQYQQIGNAVPPAMARQIAQALKGHLRINS
jgi:DNA (cytosine-5)-methyltransferase 1